MGARRSPLDVARVEQHWALARVFTPLRRGERPRLDVTLCSGEVTFRVLGPYALGIDDLGVLLALVRLAVKPAQSAPLSCEPRTDVGRALAKDLDVREVQDWDTLVVETTLRELGRVAGRNTGGTNLRAIQQSLLRLSTITVFVRSTRGAVSAHIIGWSGIAGDGRVRVALHPHVASAVVGGAVTLVDMAAWRALRGEVARRLLVWLCAWLREGETRNVGVDALAAHVWSGQTTDRRAAAKRRSSVAGALAELDGLAGWDAVVAGRCATVTRNRSRDL